MMKYTTNTVRMTGLCTFAECEDDSYAIGYFMSKTYGIFKILFKPSSNPPAFHDCCIPDHDDHAHYGKNESRSSNPSYGNFFDLSLKQGQQTIVIKNVQLAQPGSDALTFSSTWTDDVLGRHEDTSGALFQSHIVKVGKDSSQIVSKHFPVLAGKPCVVNSGVLDLFYTTSVPSAEP